MAPTTAKPRRSRPAGGKHLFFALDGALYGVPLLAVRQVVPLGALLPAPDAPCGVRGRQEWRGELIPAVDLSALLGIARAEGAPRRCLVIVASGRPELPLGLLADEPQEIADLGPLQVRPAALAIEPERTLAPATAHLGARVARLLDPAALVARLWPTVAPKRSARAASR